MEPKVHYCVHNTPLLDPILSHMYPVHTFPPYFPKTNSNTILPLRPRSSKWSLPYRFSNQNFVRISYRSHACYVPHQSHLCDMIMLITFGKVYKLWSTSLYSLLQSPANFPSKIQIWPLNKDISMTDRKHPTVVNVGMIIMQLGVTSWWQSYNSCQ